MKLKSILRKLEHGTLLSIWDSDADKCLAEGIYTSSTNSNFLQFGGKYVLSLNTSTPGYQLEIVVTEKEV